MDQLVLCVMLLATAFPVALSLINSLRLLFAFVTIILQLQQATVMVLLKMQTFEVLNLLKRLDILKANLSPKIPS